EARRQNAPYWKLVTVGRPYIHAKWAMTLDGKIATRTGDSKWITSKASRHKVHELRGRMDGNVIGIGPALADDPRLTARPPGPRMATRIVLDSSGRLPTDCQLIRTAREFPLLIATTPRAETSWIRDIEKAGGEILMLGEREGRVDVSELLSELGRRRM